jgi:RHS repeat-associated protein
VVGRTGAELIVVSAYAATDSGKIACFGATRYGGSNIKQNVYTYNRAGQPLTTTDRNGTVHTFSYDTLGRITKDVASTLGSGIDGAVRRIETVYDGQGNPYLFTQYDATTSGTVVNQVHRKFNGLGQLITEYQEHSGAVNISTSEKVQYAYSEMSGGVNHSRLTSMTYPSGFVVNYDYGTSADLNDRISRLESLNDGTISLESYSYLGLSTVVERAHAEPGLDLTYIKPSGESNADAGDQYIRLDRFDRVVDQRWLLTSGHADRFQYGYDRNGNVLYKENMLSSSMSELYHTNGSGNGYDALNQLTAFARGTLNSGKDTISSPARTQSWDYDATGNWESSTTNSITTTRTHNKQNEITGVGSATPGYAANGNMTTDETGQTLKYDAWNRLVEIKTSGGTTLSAYVPDALTRRIKETSGGTTRDLYYSASWQVLEEKVGTRTDTRQVWSPVYVDELVLRERDTNTGLSGLEERVYVVQDANHNVTALVSVSGTVLQRFVYDPFGQATVLDASWGASSDGYAWRYLHQGGRFDAAVGLYSFRFRDYDLVLGRWTVMDPIGFAAGDVNWYRSYYNSPSNFLDSQGLENWPTKSEVYSKECNSKSPKGIQVMAVDVIDKDTILVRYCNGGDYIFGVVYQKGGKNGVINALFGKCTREPAFNYAGGCDDSGNFRMFWYNIQVKEGATSEQLTAIGAEMDKALAALPKPAQCNKVKEAIKEIADKHKDKLDFKDRSEYWLPINPDKGELNWPKNQPKPEIPPLPDFSKLTPIGP